MNVLVSTSCPSQTKGGATAVKDVMETRSGYACWDEMLVEQKCGRGLSRRCRMVSREHSNDDGQGGGLAIRGEQARSRPPGHATARGRLAMRCIAPPCSHVDATPYLQADACWAGWLIFRVEADSRGNDVKAGEVNELDALGPAARMTLEVRHAERR